MHSGPASRAFQEAFPYTVPIFAGFWFVAFAYGFYMHSLGFSPLYPMIMAMIIFDGSPGICCRHHAAVSLCSAADSARCLHHPGPPSFYGIALMEKYRGPGWKKPFLIFMLCDEAFALNYSATIPYDIDKSWFYFWISLLNYLYRVTGAALDGILGAVLSFNTKGIGFIMTALFLVIFLEQWMKKENQTSAFIGLGCSVLAPALFGKDSFLIPAMVFMVILIALFRSFLEKKGESL